MSIRKLNDGKMCADTCRAYETIKVMYDRIGKRKLWTVITTSDNESAIGTKLSEAMRLMSIKLEFESYAIAEKSMWMCEAFESTRSQ
jgi:hypothetical protein